MSFAGIQNSRAGNQFGKMLLKDDSTMTMDAIESGENLLLNCITSTSIASRFGKYSRILALVTTKMNGEYGLSANLECALGLVVVKPPEPETASGDDDSDDAAYPIDFESYSRAWGFEVIDTNGDGWMGESEYYSFLYETLQDSYQLDSDGDRRLSRAESGLSEEQFRLVDRDRSGSLKVWEIRRAVGRGIWR